MSYRETAIISISNSKQLNSLANQAIETKMEKFIHKLETKILPKQAKRGNFQYTYVLPFWFRLFNSKDMIHKGYNFIINQMKQMGYNANILNDLRDNRAIHFTWDHNK